MVNLQNEFGGASRVVGGQWWLPPDDGPLEIRQYRLVATAVVERCAAGAVIRHRRARLRGIVDPLNLPDVNTVVEKGKRPFFTAHLQTRRVAGPRAGRADQSVTLLEGIRHAVGDKAKVLYARGANITDHQDLLVYLNQYEQTVKVDPQTPQAMIDDAVRTAR